MKDLFTTCVVAVLMANTSIAQSRSETHEAGLFAGETIVGERKVTADIKITEIPENLAPFKEAGFSK